MGNNDRHYEGRRDGRGEARVHIIRAGGAKHSLPAQLDLFNHSPDGFEWGYYGSGPAQLALALLFDATGDTDLSIRLHQDYKAEVVARFPREGNWMLTPADVMEWVENRLKMEKQARAQGAVIIGPEGENALG